MQPVEFLQSGIAVIPLYFQTKQPMVRWQKYQKLLPTQSEAARWFRPGRKINVAVVCGWQGLTVLDFDTSAAYWDWLVWAVTEGGKAAEVAMGTYRVRTSRGMHVYLFTDETPRCGHFVWGDIKAIGGYVLIPPSVHPSGAVYTAVDEQSPILRVNSLDGIIPDAPAQPTVPLPPLQHVYPSSDLWPTTIVEEIKARTPILSMFPDAKPTGGNRWYVARCPLHDDREPSLWIDTERGICGCYAGCFPKPVDVIGLYARLHNIGNKEAIKELASEIRL